MLLFFAFRFARFVGFGAAFAADGLLARFAEFFRTTPPALPGLRLLLSLGLFRLVAEGRRLPVNDVMKSL